MHRIFNKYASVVQNFIFNVVNTRRMNVLIIGCGAIGVTVAKAVENVEAVKKVYITDKSKQCALKLAETFSKVQPVENLETTLPEVELVIEAASQEAVREYAPLVLSHGKNMLIMSVGALVDDELRQRLQKLASEHGAKIFLPSGAVCGIDGLNASANARIDEVMLITSKPPGTFKNVAHLAAQGINLDTLTGPTILFEGTAKDAVKLFPQNVNVAATIALAGIGFDKTKVRIIADPALTRNTHRLVVRGEFGEFECDIRNVPSPRNPRTSYLAALSAIAAVKKLTGNVWVGV